MKKRILSYNVNGIRAAMRKGLVEWLSKEMPEIICFQETKAQPEQIDEEAFTELGYQCYWHSAKKKGYSGVGILSLAQPLHVEVGTGIPYMDDEGRNIRLDFSDFSVMSLYLPSGTNDARLGFKFQYMDGFYEYVKEIRKRIPNLIICGDYNICHQAIDIHDPVRNRKVSGFLPEECAWLDSLINDDFIDTFRYFNKEPDQYSWWSYRAGARARNKGWRIDYCMATAEMKPRLVDAEILQDAVHSDHCPVGVTISAD
ncbi:exodeoxyribonuclease-3 [Balneicella halophila]|uniref:Exodeoxyribonuclease-3 n=1 Tax=Balneicella halophila TaxID=1537566 RepID=A0A7L4UP45_BALHA|nr:exodeoxyribonuclease III [Balneicella halophila]PVX50903.1 exodeoxyribonuclease-3 [Balneicella halophila]